MKSPQTHSDAAEQGDVVCQNANSCSFWFSVGIFISWTDNFMSFGFCFLNFLILLGNGSYQHWQSGIGTLDTSIM